MAEVTDAASSSEPSMEEILASIRRIIADEKAPEETPAEDPADDVIELTQVVQPDGSVADLEAQTPEPAPMPEPEPIPEPEPEPIPEPMPVFQPIQAEEPLVSDSAASSAGSALETLAHTLEAERRVAPPSYTPLGNGARTLEDMTLELIKPMLKGWLDENLPTLVERIVQKEVERIAKRAQD